MGAGAGGLGSAARLRGHRPGKGGGAGGELRARPRGHGAFGGGVGKTKGDPILPEPRVSSPGRDPPRLPFLPGKLRAPQPRCRTPVPGCPHTPGSYPRFLGCPRSRGAVRRHSPCRGRAAPGRAPPAGSSAVCRQRGAPGTRTPPNSPQHTRTPSPAPTLRARLPPARPPRSHAHPERCTRTRSCTHTPSPLHRPVLQHTHTLLRSCPQLCMGTPTESPSLHSIPQNTHTLIDPPPQAPTHCADSPCKHLAARTFLQVPCTPHLCTHTQAPRTFTHHPLLCLLCPPTLSHISACSHSLCTPSSPPAHILLAHAGTAQTLHPYTHTLCTRTRPPLLPCPAEKRPPSSPSPGVLAGTGPCPGRAVLC